MRGDVGGGGGWNAVCQSEREQNAQLMNKCSSMDRFLAFGEVVYYEWRPSSYGDHLSDIDITVFLAGQYEVQSGENAAALE